jgi:hypothetical protein
MVQGLLTPAPVSRLLAVPTLGNGGATPYTPGIILEKIADKDKRNGKISARR